jgi:SH3 domain protein
MKTLRSCALALALVGGTAAADTAYVTDLLRLGLHAAQNTSDQPFQTLVSGTELEVLERVPNFAHVRTHEGREGWVKSAYLVEEKPARLIVSETEAALDRMRAEATRAENARVAAEAELSALLNDAESKVGKVSSMEAEITLLRAENEEYAERLETFRSAVPLTWAGAAFAVALFGGFFLGLWVLDAYVRRRHGGFRVY